MNRQRIGQVLSQMGKLTEIDVNEILTEQAFTHRRFGDIALAWGLCQPLHIWQAWCSQLSDTVETVDLEAVGVDAQATDALAGDLAEKYQAIPIRRFDGQLVVAAASPTDSGRLAELRQLLGRDVHFVSADPQQVRHAIQAYYACGA